MRLWRRRETLLDRLHRGEPAALRELYEQHVDALYRFVYFRCGARPAVAEDLVSETFLAALQAFGSCRDSAALGGWLRGIARRKLADHTRREGRDQRLLQVLQRSDVKIQELVRLLEGQGRHAALDDEDLQHAVGAALSELPSHYQRVLVDKYQRKHTVRAIALALEKSERAVDGLLQRARLAFREAFTTLTQGVALS